MGGGHGHEAHGAASDPHGGHGSAVADPHGHGEFPPEPATRWISPDREEYAKPWPGGLLLWPVVWLGVALLLFLAARAWSHDWTHDVHGGGGHAAPGAGGSGHGAPQGPGKAPETPKPAPAMGH
jgi:hypothetical protein